MWWGFFAILTVFFISLDWGHCTDTSLLLIISWENKYNECDEVSVRYSHVYVYIEDGEYCTDTSLLLINNWTNEYNECDEWIPQYQQLRCQCSTLSLCIYKRRGILHRQLIAHNQQLSQWADVVSINIHQLSNCWKYKYIKSMIFVKDCGVLNRNNVYNRIVGGNRENWQVCNL